MTVARLILSSLRRPTTARTTLTSSAVPINFQHRNPNFLIPVRASHNSAEEDAADLCSNQPHTVQDFTERRLLLHGRVQLFIRAGDLDQACSLVDREAVPPHTPIVFTCNSIVRGMYRAERYSCAIKYFTIFFEQWQIVPNIVSYDYLIGSYCELGYVDTALEVYQRIIKNAPFCPSTDTYDYLTKGLINAGRINAAVSLVWRLFGNYYYHSVIFNNLIAGFLRLNDLEKAKWIFDELTSRCAVYDGIVHGTFMEWYFSKGDKKEAMNWYRSFLDKKFKMEPDTGNVLLDILFKWDKEAEAEALFGSMLDRHTPPVFDAVNADTFNLLINHYFKKGKESTAYDIFKKAISKPFKMGLSCYSNMVMRYCEMGMLGDAEKVYEKLCKTKLAHDVSIYKTLIHAYVKAEKNDKAADKYREMKKRLREIPSNAHSWLTKND